MNPFPLKSVLTLLLTGALAMGTAHLALADNDDGDEEDEREEGRWFKSHRALGPVDNATYTQECGSCHLAYPPGLLPAQDWAQIMTPEALANHYGDDASLSEAVRSEISAFLAANAGDGAWQRDATSGLSHGDAPPGDLPRITATVQFRREHKEIPARLVTGNPGVKSFSQCNACHRKATEGQYDERWIDIPGYGPWSD